MSGDGAEHVSLAAARATVGDEAFNAAMADLMATAAVRAIGIHDVVDALETRSGRRLAELRRGLGIPVSGDEP